MNATVHRTRLVLAVTGALCGCAVTPSEPGFSARAPAVARASVDPRYVRPGPPPTAMVSRVGGGSIADVFDVALPPKAAPHAPPEARAPIRLRWWRPLAANGPAGPRPLVVIAPILGSETAFVESFARRFAQEGWHAAIVFHPEVAYDPARPLAQVEERLADAVMRRVEVLDWFLERGDVDRARVASLGISAGGIEASMVAGADPRYRAHVIGLAGGPLADVFIDSDEADIRRVVAVACDANHTTREGLREPLRKVIRTDPILLAPRVERDAVLLVLARLDRAVPARTGAALRDALGRPATIHLPLGHYASVLFLPFVEPRVLDFLRARFDGVPNETHPPGGGTVSVSSHENPR